MPPALQPRLTMARLALAALLRRKARVALALVALAIAATLLTALLSLYGGVRRDLSREFRRFGANIVVTGTPAAPLLPAAALPRAARALRAQDLVVGMLVQVASLAPASGSSAQNVVVVGADWSALRRLNPTWRWQSPAAAADTSAAWLGEHAARALHVAPGASLAVRLAGRQRVWRLAGIVSSGAAADNQLFVPLADLQALAGEPGFSTLEARVNGGPETVRAALAALRRALPGARVSPVRPIAAGEAAILLRTRGLLIATAALILLTLGLGLAAALASAALERRREFGLMRALGAGAGQVFSIFACEALAIAVVAAVLGYLVGGALAAWMAAAVFGALVAPGIGIFTVTLAATLLLAALAALAPWPVVRRAAPATILKGD